jgi:hypothetical protein
LDRRLEHPLSSAANIQIAMKPFPTPGYINLQARTGIRNSARISFRK